MQNTDVLIINPPVHGKMVERDDGCTSTVKAEYVTPQINSGITAAMLREEFRVTILDCLAEGMTHEDFYARLDRMSGVKIFILSTAYPSFYGDMEVGAACKKKFPDATLIGWGVPFQFNSEEYMGQYPFIDIALQDASNVEELTLELCQYLKRKKYVLDTCEKEFETFTGIHYVKNGECVTTPPKKLSGVYQYPFPAYDLMPPLKKFRHPVVKSYPFSVVVASRGCPHACEFCSAAFYPFRSRRAEDVYNEFEYLVREHRVKEIFIKDNFFENRKAVFEFCDLIIRNRLKVRWFTMARCDVLDEEFVKKITAAGCRMLSIGVESLNQDMLDSMKKNARVEDFFNVFDRCRRHGIQTVSHIIFGFPGETTDTITETSRMIKKLKTDFASFNVVVPYPGTALYKLYKDKGYIYTDDLTQYDQSGLPVYNLPGLSAEEIFSQMKAAYSHFYDLRKKAQIFLNVRSFNEFTLLLKSGYYMLFKTLKKS